MQKCSKTNLVPCCPRDKEPCTDPLCPYYSSRLWVPSSFLEARFPYFQPPVVICVAQKNHLGTGLQALTSHDYCEKINSVLAKKKALCTPYSIPSTSCPNPTLPNFTHIHLQIHINTDIISRPSGHPSKVSIVVI